VRPHRKNTRNEKNTEKLSRGLPACQFYICHKDSKFSMLHKPITGKKKKNPLCQVTRVLKMFLASGEDESATTDRGHTRFKPESSQRMFLHLAQK